MTFSSLLLCFTILILCFDVNELPLPKAFGRRICARNILLRNRASKYITTWYRGLVARRKWIAAVVKSQTRISAHLRGLVQKRRFITRKRRHRAASIIQVMFRSDRFLRVVRKLRRRAIKIQVGFC